MAASHWSADGNELKVSVCVGGVRLWAAGWPLDGPDASPVSYGQRGPSPADGPGLRGGRIGRWEK